MSRISLHVRLPDGGEKLPVPIEEGGMGEFTVLRDPDGQQIAMAQLELVEDGTVLVRPAERSGPGLTRYYFAEGGRDVAFLVGDLVMRGRLATRVEEAARVWWLVLRRAGVGAGSLETAQSA